jgi:hypothetical protein
MPPELFAVSGAGTNQSKLNPFNFKLTYASNDTYV